MTKHRMGTLHFLLFYICAIVIAAPPLNLKAPPSGSSSYSENNLGLSLTQTAAYDTLLDLFPSSTPAKLPLSSITNSSVKVDLPPDPYILPTQAGDHVTFGRYSDSPYLSDLLKVVEIANEDAIQHSRSDEQEPMPEELNYRYGHASMHLLVRPRLTWTRWASALRQIVEFQRRAGSISFIFDISVLDLFQSLGFGQVRTSR